MAADLHFTALGHPATVRSSSVLSHLGGLATTVAIFTLLAWIGGAPEEGESVSFNEVESVALFDLPPPPRIEEVPEPSVPVINDLLLLAEERTGSDIKLSAAPIVPEFVPQASGRIQFELSVNALKPSVAQPAMEARRIFERSEVDEPPRAILKKSPRITQAMAKELKVQRIRFLFVVNLDGSVEQIRVLASTGDAAADSICVAALKAWKFTPGIRKNKQVRCWVEQSFNIRASTKSPFES
jgi:TonB family protein